MTWWEVVWKSLATGVLLGIVALGADYMFYWLSLGEDWTDD